MSNVLLAIDRPLPYQRVLQRNGHVITDSETKTDIAIAGEEQSRSLNGRLSCPVIAVAPGLSAAQTQTLLQEGIYYVFTDRPNLEQLKDLIDEAPSVVRIETTNDGLIGSSTQIKHLRRQIQRIAPAGRVTVLLSGESGTGKNLTARLIHEASERKDEPFVEINCAALPEDLLEAELFGYEKGAFTGASQAKAGLLEIADGGTVLLDEINSMSPALQAKLLSFLESQQVRRVGGTKAKTLDTRVICATNQDLRASVQRSDFRADLYWRINVVRLQMPTLAEIREDIPAIASHLLEGAVEMVGQSVEGFTKEAIQQLKNHPWHGNVRELRNVIERATVFADDVITADDLMLEETSAPTGTYATFHRVGTLEEIERAYLAHMLDRYNDETYSYIADQLGIAQKTLWEKRKRYNLNDL